MSPTPRKLPPIYRAILFDLDGTLTDPAEGITRSIQYALERLGYSAPSAPDLYSWIGPSLRESFAHYLHTDDPHKVAQAITFYRDRFARVGLFENVVYPGIPALLADLQRLGCRLFLATSKPQVYARRILEHFDLATCFAVIGGATLDGRLHTKADVIASLLPQLRADERAAIVMVGDREQDIVGAHMHGIPAIAVSYGYGSVAELVACAPDCVVCSVAELRTILVGGAASADYWYDT